MGRSKQRNKKSGPRITVTKKNPDLLTKKFETMIREKKTRKATFFESFKKKEPALTIQIVESFIKEIEEILVNQIDLNEEIKFVWCHTIWNVDKNDIFTSELCRSYINLLNKWVNTDTDMSHIKDYIENRIQLIINTIVDTWNTLHPDLKFVSHYRYCFIKWEMEKESQ